MEAGAVQKARVASTLAQDELRRSGPLHLPSFELGVASTFTQLLGTAQQRSVLNDAMQGTKDVPQGIETLHQLALINRATTEATQCLLADRIGADRGNFNRRIRRLEAIGLVDSQRQGPSLLYTITALGLDVLTELRPGWRAIHPSTLGDIADDDEARKAAADLVAVLGLSIEGGLDKGMTKDLPGSLHVSRLQMGLNVSMSDSSSLHPLIDAPPRLEQAYFFEPAAFKIHVQPVANVA